MDLPAVPYLQITASRVASTVTVVVAGEVDLMTVGELRTGLLASMASDASAAMELDLSRVSFLDCAGIGALIGIRRDAARSGTHVVIIDASPAVLRVLTVFDLDVTFGYRRPAPAITHRWWQRRPPLFRRLRTDPPASRSTLSASETRLSA